VRFATRNAKSRDEPSGGDLGRRRKGLGGQAHPDRGCVIRIPAGPTFFANQDGDGQQDSSLFRM